MIAGYLVVTLPDGSFNFANVFIFWSALAAVASVAAFCLAEKPVDHSKFETSGQ